MEVNFDQYIRNFRMFYNQLVKGHSKEEQLAPLFKQLLEQETKKWKKNLAIRANNRTGETANLLAKLKGDKTGKNKSKVNIQVLYASVDIRNLIVFGYCFLLMEHKNTTALQYLTEGMKDPLADKQLFSEPMLRKVRTLWEKMEQTISGKRRIIRFQKQLQDSFKDMPQFIMDIMYKIIVRDHNIDTEDSTAYCEGISRLLGIKIQYFTIDAKEQLQFKTFGEKNIQQTMKFGLFIKDKIYGYVSKLPEKQENQVNKEVTMTIFAEISEVLGTMYAENNTQYIEFTKNKGKQGKLRRSGSVNANNRFKSIGGSMLKRSNSEYAQI